MAMFGGLFIPIVLVGLLIFTSAIKVLREYERAVVFRLGRLIGAQGPGSRLLIPVIDKMMKIAAAHGDAWTCRRRTSSPRTTSR